MITVPSWRPARSPRHAARVVIDGVPYYDGGHRRRYSRAPCPGKKDVTAWWLILSKRRDYVRKPQGMRFLYSALCRKYPKIIEAIDQRHITYTKNQKEVFDLEKEGKAFIFAPSEPVKVGTYSMDEETEKKLYDLGMKDFKDQLDALHQFIYSRTV